MLQRVNSVALIRRGGKYLVLRRSMWNKLYRGQWQFPEGGIKFGESPEKALARELREETGLKIRKAKLLGTRSSNIVHFGRRLWHFVRLFYRCEASGTLRLSRAHDEHRWVTKAELKRLRLLKGFNYSGIKGWL